jgi:hypothetical protein
MIAVAFAHIPKNGSAKLLPIGSSGYSTMNVRTAYIPFTHIVTGMGGMCAHALRSMRARIHSPMR